MNLIKVLPDKAKINGSEYIVEIYDDMPDCEDCALHDDYCSINCEDLYNYDLDTWPLFKKQSENSEIV